MSVFPQVDFSMSRLTCRGNRRFGGKTLLSPERADEQHDLNGKRWGSVSAGRKVQKQDRGQSLVEFALVAPVLLVILLGVVDLGRAIYYYNTLSNLAREGARAGIVLQTSDEWNQPGNLPDALNSITYSGISSYTGTNSIAGKIASEAVIFDLSKVTVKIEATMGKSNYAALPLTVTVQYPFDLLYANWIAASPTITMTGQATMRIE